MGDTNREPSMEEILASIKRVIAEDGRASMQQHRPPRRPQPVIEAVPSEPAEPQDVLELSDPVSEENGLLSPGATDASRNALAALAALRQGEAMAQAPAGAEGDTPLEAAVKDLLRPMLKEWLDQRLPDMVEELVTREIARITGKHL